MSLIIRYANPAGRLLKKTGLIMLVLAWTAISTGQAFALDAQQRRLIESGSRYFDIDGSDCTPTNTFATNSGSGSGGSLYVIGDSLTVGMRDSGGLDEKLKAAGWQPTAINAVTGKDLRWGKSQLQANAATLSSSEAVLIGLGTNNIGDVIKPNADEATPGGRETVEAIMQEMVDVVKAARPDVRIYWTSVYMTGILSGQGGSYDLDIAGPVLNEALNSVAQRNGVAVIPWGTSNEARQFTSPDGIHPSGKYPEMADYIVGQLNNAGAGVPQGTGAGCVCGAGSGSLTGLDNQQQAFNYFVGQGYTPEQAAGIVGNMIHESGVEPMRFQGTPMGTKISSADVLSGNVPGPGPAWGIVQWDPPRKMIKPAVENGNSYATIDTLEFQLEVVWRQLEGTGVGGLAQINEAKAGRELKKTTTPEDAAVAFGHYYERFAGSDDLSNPRYAERRESARQVFDIYAGSAPSPGSSAGGCTTAGTPGTNGWEIEGPNAMVYYSQRSSGSDPAVDGYFGNAPYGPGPISHCGCGPTSWAMIVATLTGKAVTPPTVASWAASNGWQLPAGADPCGGSKWWWASNPQQSELQWGVAARSITIDEAPAVLRAGGLIIMSSSSSATGVESPFTSGGHLLVMRAVTDDGRFFFADPNDYDDPRPVAQAAFNGQSKSRTSLAPEQFMPSTQGLWAVTKIGQYGNFTH